MEEKGTCDWVIDYSRIKGKPGIKKTSEGFNSTNNPTFITECGFEAVADWEFLACDIDYCPNCLKLLSKNENKELI